MLKRIVVILLFVHAVVLGSLTARMIRWSFLNPYDAPEFKKLYQKQKAVLGPLFLWWIAPQIPIADIGRMSDIDPRAERESLKRRLPYYHATLNAYSYGRGTNPLTDSSIPSK